VILKIVFEYYYFIYYSNIFNRQKIINRLKIKRVENILSTQFKYYKLLYYFDLLKKMDVIKINILNDHSTIDHNLLKNIVVIHTIFT